MHLILVHDIKTNISLIALNVNGLNTSIEKKDDQS